ncbi:MAG: PAQR family membrane homeostasis protein TrhA [Peptoniphilaceae bacterium]
MKNYETKEEIINYTSHFTALIILTILILPIILEAIFNKNMEKFISFTAYYLAVGSMFSSSVIYHFTSDFNKKRIFRLLDHCAIYLCIAGTYTPILILATPGKLSVLIALIVWLIAFIGIFIKIYSFKNDSFELANKTSIVLYLLMGWISLFLFKNIINGVGLGFFASLLAGGILYSVGVYFYKNDKIKYNHAIWHILIVAATFSILYGILKYLYI